VTSAIKVETNRRNSLRSTGPKTPEGKQVASRNATKLGLFSRELLLRDESEVELHLLARAVRADLQPDGPIEQALVELIISVLWRLRRLLRIESGLFEMYKVYKGLDGGAAVAFAHDASQLGCFGRLDRAETSLERRLYKAMQELRNLQRGRRMKSVPPPIEVEASQVSTGSNEQNSSCHEIEHLNTSS
jgi:hypothetical protein